MGIPDYKTVMLPLLKLSSDGIEHSIRDAIDQLADEFNLSQEERQELLPSGKQAVFRSRVGWARTYMKMAGLLESEKRGYFKITSRGLDVLKQNPKEINIDLLWQFEEFREFKNRARESQKKHKVDVPEVEEDITPEESLEYGYQ